MSGCKTTSEYDVIVLKTDGTYIIESATGFEDYSRFVGGYITLLPSPLVDVYVNEEGKLKCLPYNTWTPFILSELELQIHFPILGDVVLVSSDEDGDDIRVSDTVKEMVQKEFLK